MEISHYLLSVSHSHELFHVATLAKNRAPLITKVIFGKMQTVTFYRLVQHPDSLKEYISNEAFSEPKDGSYSSLSYLTNRLGVKDIDISLDNIDYNYNVTIDARVYPALELASTIWLVQNLRTTVNVSNVEIESFNYDDNIQYIGQYGKLYKWNIALDICPTGWLLPTTSEWNELINYYGGFDDALNHLYYEGSSGFNFRYAGFRTPGEFYQGLNDQTMFWCYDEFSSEDAYCYTFTKAGTSITKQTLSKDYALSVRCVRDY